MPRILILALALPLLIACSDQGEAQQGEHVWKEQTDTIKKAEDAAKQMEQVTTDNLKELQQQ